MNDEWYVLRRIDMMARGIEKTDRMIFTSSVCVILLPSTIHPSIYLSICSRTRERMCVSTYVCIHLCTCILSVYASIFLIPLLSNNININISINININININISINININISISINIDISIRSISTYL